MTSSGAAARVSRSGDTAARRRQRGEDIALGWRIVFDEPKARRARDKHPAERAFSAVVTGLDARLARPTKKDGSFACFARDKIGPLGAKAQGECAINPVSPAISNALLDATGVRFAHLPFTPDRIFDKLAAKP